jgi:transcriptional regulator with XRE-family HTH domain
VAELLADGLSYAEIGRRLGITGQAIRHYVTRPLRPPQTGVACRTCGGVAVAAEARVRERGEGLCPACLRWQGAPFARVLRACRLAAGMNKSELARRSGVSYGSLREYEAGLYHPRRTNLDRLAAVLGEGLLPPA